MAGTPDERRKTMRDPTEKQTTEALINACMELQRCLEESHQEEIKNDHFGDMGCLYCDAIKESAKAIKNSLKWHCNA
jgi:hypothetical protein